jgi:hypothetical protein
MEWSWMDHSEKVCSVIGDWLYTIYDGNDAHYSILYNIVIDIYDLYSVRKLQQWE